MERYWEQVYGGKPQQHRPVELDPTSNYPVEKRGGRFVDVAAPGGRGGTLGVEVKTYGRWRTVEGVPREKTVPLRDVQEQVNKDIHVRESDPSFDPRWIFADAPPSEELANYLRRARITFITVGPPGWGRP